MFTIIFGLIVCVVYVARMLVREFDIGKPKVDPGYDHHRQVQLERMAGNCDKKEQAEIERLCGRKVNFKSSDDRKLAVREIASKEGWTYFDFYEHQLKYCIK